MKIVKEWLDTLLMIKNFKTKRVALQRKDIYKMWILVPVFLVQGGTILVIILVKYSKRFGFDLSLSKSFPIKEKE
jgi:hypothetical protein